MIRQEKYLIVLLDYLIGGIELSNGELHRVKSMNLNLRITNIIDVRKNKNRKERNIIDSFQINKLYLVIFNWKYVLISNIANNLNLNIMR